MEVIKAFFEGAVKVVKPQVFSDNRGFFQESYTKNNTLKPRINLYPFDHPLFQQDDGKVKNQYIMK